MAKTPNPKNAAKPVTTKPRKPTTQQEAVDSRSKAAIVRDLLLSDAGSTLTELCAATGWQPHSVRAFLTGLRKKHSIIRYRSDDQPCYRIVESADA